jgi:hypothetical protein
MFLNSGSEQISLADDEENNFLLSEAIINVVIKSKM